MARTKTSDEHWPDYWPGKILDSNRKGDHELIQEASDNDNTFHIGQIYENEAAKLIECSECGGRSFNVGVGNCFTAIRCVTCEWEICIHNG